MAGRVGRRINDKFYFVVDEVGESSDCESELTSDNDVKPMDILPKGSSVIKADDTLEKKSNPIMSEDENKTPDVEVINRLNFDENASECSVIVEENIERKPKNETTGSTNVKEKSVKHKSALPSEESLAVVDMDIDSDMDSAEPRVKPLLKVTFRDEAVEKRFKSSFFKFFSQKFEDCTIVTNSENDLEFEVYDKKIPENDLLDFNLDTTPGDNPLDVPDYGKSHDLVLSDKSLGLKQNGEKSGAAKTGCFNCLGNHNLRECPKAKDFKEINKNRLKFQQNQKAKQPKTSRYHLDENQKFSHLVPGVISKKLRNALNLKRDQQPGFIYRMRLLGYPPAWLEEAKVSHSGVAMYDDRGVPVLEEDEEEGEILPEGAKDKFDITKIIEFPGFNVPLPNNFKDESKFYHCPALSEDQSKENLIKLLEPKTVQAYVKKSLNSQKCDKSSAQTENKRMASPTIEEMEEKKRQLLMALNGEESTFEARAPAGAEAVPACPSPTAGECGASGKVVGAVKNLEFGTPILKSVSPFSKLPPREQFSCNMSDIINFENLPNSTGKYESMREVITKIRVSISKAQKE